MEAWIYRIMTARDPNWRSLSRDPNAGASQDRRIHIENSRRER